MLYRRKYTNYEAKTLGFAFSINNEHFNFQKTFGAVDFVSYFIISYDEGSK